MWAAVAVIRGSHGGRQHQSLSYLRPVTGMKTRQREKGCELKSGEIKDLESSFYVLRNRVFYARATTFEMLHGFH